MCKQQKRQQQQWQERETQKIKFELTRAPKLFLPLHVIYIRENASSWVQKMTLLNASKEIFGAKRFQCI